MSAVTLLRPLFEAAVRGTWLLLCATEGELKRFELGKIDKSIRELVDAVEAEMNNPQHRMLSDILRDGWKGLNGFTHTGMNMVSRQFSPGRLEANIPDDELCTAVKFAGVVGLLAAYELVLLAGGENGAIVEAFIKKMAEFVKLIPE